MRLGFAYQRLSGDVAGSSSSPAAYSRTEDHWESEKLAAQRRSQRAHWIVHFLSLVATVTLLILLLADASITGKAARCWDLHNYYLSRKPHITTRFNGSLWYDSPFKGPPTPAVEEAWHSIMEYGMIAVSASDYEQVNHSTRTAVMFPNEAGGGYMATTVGTHQLHCLHYLWQDHHSASFPDTLRKMQDVPEMYERHYEHCVDYIRQGIMCQFDTGLITYDWVLQHQNPTPNSNAMHKCVDWDATQGWLKDRAVQIPDGFVWKQPAGQESLPWNP